MNQSEPTNNGSYPGSEDSLRELLINKIVVISAVVAVLAFAFAELRAFEIGWTYRDLGQFSAVSLFVVLAFIREKLSSRHKAIILIVAYSAGGFPGVYNFGMLAGTVFIFPTVAVLVALFYSVRTTIVFLVVLILFYMFMAMGFCSGLLTYATSPEFLMVSYSHWFVYVICLGVFFAVSCLTILDYRKAMGLLISEMRHQRDELAKTNEDLLSALADVNRLSGLLPICSSCKKIRDDKGYWNQLESYIQEHSEAEFSHGICPECSKKLYPDLDGDD